MGVLLATGLIVGESLFGVVFAGDRRGARGKDAPLALIDDYRLGGAARHRRLRRRGARPLRLDPRAEATRSR